MANLFTYGTLMHPSVWKIIGHENCPSAKALLRHYSARCLDGLEYPGLIEEQNATVQGILYFNLNETDMEKIDRFEGDAYERIGVTAWINNTEVEAQTYLYIGDDHIIKSEEWAYQNADLNSFLKRNQF